MAGFVTIEKGLGPEGRIAVVRFDRGDERVRAFLCEANPQAATAIADKFEEAERRGFWTSRRNSSAEILAQMRDGSRGMS